MIRFERYPHTAYIADQYAAAALWLPPGSHGDEDGVGELFTRMVPKPHRDDLFELFEGMGSYHPSEPHWYLPLIGVDPLYQRRGIGSKLMNVALEEIDEQGGLAYLENGNALNTALYERLGFEVIGEISAGDSPPMFPMIRKPR